MLKIDLQSDEVLILNESGWIDRKNGDIFLTNKRIVWAKPSMFGNNIKEQQEWLLSSIKLHNGEPQVKVVGDILEPDLQIQTNEGIINLRFGGRRATMHWQDEIHVAITGHKPSKDLKSNSSFAIPGADILGKGIKDTVEAFTTGLGIKEAIGQDKQVMSKCPGCGAPLSGKKGEKVKCCYCDSVHILK